MSPVHQLLAEAVYYLIDFQVDLRGRGEPDEEMADLIKRIKVHIR